MSEFDDLLEEYLGDADVLSDQIVVVRRLWFYDFEGYPTRMWQGKGRLFTSDGNEWLGTINSIDQDLHVTPRLQDGRDGTSAAYQFSLTIPDIPDEPAGDLYNALKEDQNLAFGRNLTCYLAIFKHGEALRPTTPIKFFKQLVMGSPKFSEGLVQDGNGMMVRSYKVGITCRDANFGRANLPNRTYNDTTQREYARQIGDEGDPDKGCEFVASLANRTYQIP